MVSDDVAREQPSCRRRRVYGPTRTQVTNTNAATVRRASPNWTFSSAFGGNVKNSLFVVVVAVADTRPL